MATELVGIAPLTTVRRTDGTAANVYHGGPVPDDITDDDRIRLLAEGFIAETPLAAGGMQHDVPGQVPAFIEQAKPVSAATRRKAEALSNEEANVQAPALNPKADG